MDETAIIRYIADTFAGVDILQPQAGSSAPEIAWGDTFFSYDPDGNLDPKHRLPFVTIVTKDYGDYDRASDLDRPGVFRLNIGIGKDTYRSLFGPQPSPPGPTAVVDTRHDFTALDQILPHPVYSPQSWVCVLNPSDATFETVRPLIQEAYDLALRRYARTQQAEQP